MISSIISRVVILVFGTLYPAYASYKAVRTASVKEYVKWMMYWIVFAFFTCIETFTDIFLAWFPFYYEIKVITVLWLLSPVTKGSSTLYRKFVHPMLTRREQEIDEYINQAKEKGYSAVLQLGSKGVNYATTVIMQTAIKTIQNVPINAPKTTELRAITQEGDTPDSVYMETNMLNEMNEYPTESTQQYPNYLNSSSEDEEEYHDEKDEDWNAGGAARSRGVTTKRTQPARRTTRSSSANSNTTNVRARRRIRPDPELLIEVD